ncbi:MAG: ABC transporter permease [Anaerolineales bacterium]|nr:ABC transporter permease [Anaerolineales bacterium]MCX7754824.1 ABC transporter permease [Anaerolineales bacterium]MDW8277801.1 ABC transporter permease [Anaerolineales bacterium]
MLLTQNILTALRSLMANKLRSALTILGIVIGVAAVVALMAIGNGATSDITSQIQSAGTNLLSVQSGRMQRPQAGGAPPSFSPLTLKDYEALQAGLSNVAGIAPVYSSSATVVFQNDSYSVSVTGTSEDYLKVYSYEMEKGRFFTASDRQSVKQVAVLGATTAGELFPNTEAIGQSIKINDVRFTVIGVLKAKGSSGFSDPDDIVLIPLETGYLKLFGANAIRNGQKTLNTIAISAASADAVDSVKTQINFILRRQHKLAAEAENDFRVQSQSDMLETLSTVTTTLTTFLGAIAAISLLVGGIGIMNITLVSVSERTREIGLRKAVGARKDHILIQFLIETMTLSLLGGVLGILLGVGIAQTVSALGLINSLVTASSILLAFTFSLAIGLFFGIYPAWRAANLHPMEALRSE